MAADKPDKPAPAPKAAAKFVTYHEDGAAYPAVVTPTGLVVFGLPSGAAELRAAPAKD